MSLSLNELEALCRKAARGAGLPWGVAEEAGWAARRLAAIALPGPELLLARLARHDVLAAPVADEGTRVAPSLSPRSLAGDWRGEGEDLCPILAGASLGDVAERVDARGGVTLHGVLSPLLLVPFAGLVARRLGRTVRLAWEDVVLSEDGEGTWLDGPGERARIERAGTVRCRALPPDVARPGARLSPVTRARPDPLCLERLEALARRTCAPATEESRRRGAGSSTDDPTGAPAPAPPSPRICTGHREERRMDRPMPGQPLPAIAFPLLDGGHATPGTSGAWELLVVYRGRFCPRCKAYLARLDGLLERLRAIDVAVLVVSADPEGDAAADRAEHGWRFPLGHSLDVGAMRTLGLYVTEADPSRQDGEPHAEPGVFLTTPDGRVQILSTSNAASCRPDLDILVDGIEATLARGMPIRGTL